MTESEAKEVLYELENVLRSRPDRSVMKDPSDENIEWQALACATMYKWNPLRYLPFELAIKDLIDPSSGVSNRGIVNVLRQLNQARFELKMELDPVSSLVVEAGGIYQYFEHIRKHIELAQKEIFFIDPYLDADFISRYLSYVKSDVAVKLLTNKNIKTLAPAAELFSKQSGVKVEIRSPQNLHDRYLIVDGKSCYQSGASFKDGAKNAPTALIEITDVFQAVKDAYDRIWNEATIISRG